MSRPPVTLHPRRYLTPRQKQQRWTECGGCCQVCGLPCLASGPLVIWDHRIPLALGGDNALSNLEPHHAVGCAGIKTARDRTAIAKAKRLARKALRRPLEAEDGAEATTSRKSAQWPSRSIPAPARGIPQRADGGWSRTLRRKLDGTVERRR